MAKAWVFALIKEDLLKRFIDDLKDIPEVEEMYKAKGDDFNLMILIKGKNKEEVKRIITMVRVIEPCLKRMNILWTERC